MNYPGYPGRSLRRRRTSLPERLRTRVFLGEIFVPVLCEYFRSAIFAHFELAATISRCRKSVLQEVNSLDFIRDESAIHLRQTIVFAIQTLGPLKIA